ncbi:hypothetical protein SDC9_103914 [bioreactor metagenome]|uniref:Uncharacterized protein n=1 Tax=bioreactor metagenome TaxID=1076179 RepID=A0A645AWB7_9ZZZZ
MDALRGEDLEPALATEALGLLGPHPGRVDDVAGPHPMGGAGLQVGEDRADDASVGVLQQLGELGAGGGQGAEAGGGAHQVDDQPGVVHPGVVEPDRPAQGVLADAGEELLGTLARVVLLQRDGLAVGADDGQCVVHADADGAVGPLDHRRTQRPEEGLGLDQVRGRGGQQQAAFLEGLGDQLEVQLVEVAQPAVDELAGAARGALAPVAGLDDSGAQAPGRGIEGDPGAGDTSTDHEDVELLVRHRLEGRLTRLAGQPGTGHCLLLGHPR